MPSCSALLLTVLLAVLLGVTASASSSSHPVSVHKQHRQLRGVDLWATAPACLERPPSATATATQTDSMGRRWGFEGGRSCAFKDEQQQPLLSPGAAAPPLQDWETAPACPEPAAPDNAAPDSLGRLWGVSWGKSCAFKAPASSRASTAPGVPNSTTTAAPARPNSPSPSMPATAPRQSPSPRPVALPTTTSLAAPTPRPAPAQLPRPILRMALLAPSRPSTSSQAVLPSPSATVPSASLAAAPSPSPSPLPSPAQPASPPPAPTLKSTSAAECDCKSSAAKTPVTAADADEIATLIAAQLWDKLTAATSEYEGFRAAEADGPQLNTSGGVRQQQQQVKQMVSLLAAIQTLAQQAVKGGGTAQDTDLMVASQFSNSQPASRPSSDPSAMGDPSDISEPPKRPSDNPRVLDVLDTAPPLNNPGNVPNSNPAASPKAAPSTVQKLPADVVALTAVMSVGEAGRSQH